MKFTLSWLKEFLETDASLNQISEKLTALGLEVEEIIDNSASLKDFIVAEILEATQHPNADKLRVCKVADGAGERQVVCGAPNARAGIKVVLATEGIKIPANGMTIKKSTIRGVESNGMLCSNEELGLSGDSAGIIELPLDAKVGESAIYALGVDDPVIDIAITPNRADCLGVYGIARDLAAAGLGKLKPLKLPEYKALNNSKISVNLANENCSKFIGCYISGVKDCASPAWLQNRLKAIGIKSISAIVDITNYINISYSRPLHAYDADKLNGNLTVRLATENEKFSALNDKEYLLTKNDIVIADEKNTVALAGIIGGKESSVSETTQNIFLEAALFDAVSIAKTGRRLAIDSDARYRFERGVDPEFILQGAKLAVGLILEICGGEASEFLSLGKTIDIQKTINFDYNKVFALGGVVIEKEQIYNILQLLGFECAGELIKIPSWRADIDCEAALIEEVLRVYGYDNIPENAMPYAQSCKLSAAQQRTSLMRKELAVRGLNEIYSWAFLAEKQAKNFGVDNPLKLLNPISADLDVMRPNLLANLLSAIARNSARGFSSLGLFEIGNAFEDVSEAGHKLYASGIRSDKFINRNHLGASREVDLFDAKSDLFSVLEIAGLSPDKLQISREVPAYYHPTRSGRISLGGKITLGYFGEIHPLILADFDIKQRVVAFEALLNNIPLPKSKNKSKSLLYISNFQSAERDFAFIADEKIQVVDIIKAIEKAEKNLIKKVNIFDIYIGKGVESGKKSVAISVSLQANDRTLTDKEIEDISTKIISEVANLGVTLRS